MVFRRKWKPPRLRPSERTIRRPDAAVAAGARGGSLILLRWLVDRKAKNYEGPSKNYESSRLSRGSIGEPATTMRGRALRQPCRSQPSNREGVIIFDLAEDLRRLS
jgi:hypothetical protein